MPFPKPKVTFEPVRELAFGSITASYVLVGTALAQPDGNITIKNTTDVDIYISFDNVNNHLRLPPNSFDNYDVDMLVQNTSRMPQGMGIWAKQQSGSPSKGAIIVQVFGTAGGTLI